ncbi:MAG: undecaprenyl-diphosphate phosphatase [Salibacteraceae bacterium]
MDFSELLKAFILGIIQGLTEFLPVSSSGHLELGKALLEFGQNEDALLFSILVHGATALSTIVVFRKVIIDLFKGLLEFRWNDSTRYAAMILLSMVPVGIVGVGFEDHIEALFEGQLVLVGFMLILTGGLLFFTAKAGNPTGKVTFGKAVLIGLAQAVAILPGISRSGSTISTALLAGVSRENAARFSFLMVLPPILGATLLEVKDYIEEPSSAFSPAALAVGFLAAFLSGLLACNWMIRIVKNAKLQYFAWYCFAVGALAVVLSLSA